MMAGEKPMQGRPGQGAQGPRLVMAELTQQKPLAPPTVNGSSMKTGGRECWRMECSPMSGSWSGVLRG